MEEGAKGCEVIVSGKLRAQRAKSMKFGDGFMKHSGFPTRSYIDSAVRHVLLRQGVIGLKVKIMLPHDPQGKIGPSERLPDHVSLRGRAAYAACQRCLVLILPLKRRDHCPHHPLSLSPG